MQGILMKYAPIALAWKRRTLACSPRPRRSSTSVRRGFANARRAVVDEILLEFFHLLIIEQHF